MEFNFKLETKNNHSAMRLRNQGNRDYEKGHYLNAIYSYNESLCKAQTDEALALAYGNRSAVYFELKLFKICLENIELAIKHNYPRNRMTKLFDRKNKCQGQLDRLGDIEPNQNAKDFFKLSHPAHPKIPFIVDCIELKREKVYGRGLYATKDLNPGDIIAIETPVQSILTDSARFNHCCNCLKVNNFNLIPCKKTGSLMFCSSKCMDMVYTLRDRDLNMMLKFQDSISPDRHNFELKKLGFLPEEHQIMRDSNPDLTIFDCDVYTGDEETKRKNLHKCLFSLKPSTIYGNQNKNWKSYFHYMVHRNSMNLDLSTQRDDGQLEEIHANSLCLFGSLLNHSCDPNVKRHALDEKMVFYVSKPVKNGEQLCISYGTLFADQDRTTRRLKLKRYEFTCECNACANNWPLVKEYAREREFKLINKLTEDEALKELKFYNQMIKDEFSSYPNEKLCWLIARNYYLSSYISSIAMFPLKLNSLPQSKIQDEEGEDHDYLRNIEKQLYQSLFLNN